MTETIQWEYRIETIGSALRGAKDEEIEAALNELGEAGWDVISAHPPTTNSSKVRVVAKRPLTTATRRQRSRVGSY